MRSVVIHRYIKAGGDGAGRAKGHIRYIQYRGGHDKEKARDEKSPRPKRELFDAERDSVNRRELNKLIDRETYGGVAIHKLTLSPGIQGVDMKAYTREVMDELGREKGQELQWAAVIHRNTEHDHAHVVVMGRDKEGHRVRIERGDHDLLREKGDAYLDREHSYERELERERRNIERLEREEGWVSDERLDRLLGLVRDEPEREREEPSRLKLGADAGSAQSDGSYQEKLKGPEPHAGLKEREQEEPFSKERALETMAERDKILVQEQVYTKFSTSEELKALDEHLKTHFEDRIEKREYAMLQRWVETKERYGEDCYERWEADRDERDRQREEERAAQAAREWHEFDKQARRAYEERSGVIDRHLSKTQWLAEERGRTLEYHATYTSDMAEQRLLDARERTHDELVKEEIDRELEILQEYSREVRGELEPLDLDRLLGEPPERQRDNREREPDRSLDVDNIKFPDPLAEPRKEHARHKGEDWEKEADKTDPNDKNREDNIADESQDAETDQTENQLTTQQQTAQEQQELLKQAEAQDQVRQLGETQGQQIHEQKVFQADLEREEEEREHTEM